MQCVCGNNDWTVGQNKVVVNVEQDGKMLSDKGHKLAMMICNACGRVEFYHIDAVHIAMQREINKIRDDDD